MLGKAHRNVTPHQSGEPTDEKHDRPRPSSASNDGSDGQSYENERRKEIDPLHVGLSHLFLFSWRAYCSLCWHFAGNRAMRHQLKHCTEHNKRPPTAIPCSEGGHRESRWRGRPHADGAALRRRLRSMVPRNQLEMLIHHINVGEIVQHARAHHILDLPQHDAACVVQEVNACVVYK